MKILQSKKAISPVITTVLLVLIGIVAVGLLSSFVINFVRNNLQTTDCINIQGKITLDMESGFTFFNITSNDSSVVVKNDWSKSNISGLNIILDDGTKSITYKVRVDASDSKVTMFSGDSNAAVILPQSSNPKVTYKINSSDDFKSTIVKKVLVIPVIGKESVCNEAADEKTMPAYP